MLYPLSYRGTCQKRSGMLSRAECITPTDDYDLKMFFHCPEALPAKQRGRCPESSGLSKNTRLGNPLCRPGPFTRLRENTTAI